RTLPIGDVDHAGDAPSRPRQEHDMRNRTRVLALSLAMPMSLFAYHPLAALASTTATCDGHAVTMTVGAHSPHTVDGTGHRDVIRITAPGHVVHGEGGSDIICGSSGADTIFGDSGNDIIFAGGGNDTVSGGDGNDVEHGG